MGVLTIFKCRFSPSGTAEKTTLSTVVRGRTASTLGRIAPLDADVTEFAGAYVSTELQKSYRFRCGPDGLTAEKFLDRADARLTQLDKDLFGFDRGFILFTRYPDGAISGFKLMTYATDTFLGSKFVRL